MARSRRVGLWLLAAAMAMALMRMGVSLLDTPWSPALRPSDLAEAIRARRDRPAISPTNAETQEKRPAPPCVSAAPREKVVR